MDGSLPKRKPGLKKKNQTFSAKHLKEKVTTFVLSQVNSKQKLPERKDNFRKEVIRFVFKIPRELLNTWATRNKFWRDKLKDNAFAYCEAFYGFIKAFGLDLEEHDLLRAYVEFIILYFPKAKVQRILDNIRQNGSYDFLDTFAPYFSQREKKSLHHVKNWVRESTILKSMFSFVQCVVKDHSMKTISSQHSKARKIGKKRSKFLTSSELINNFILEML